VRTVGNVALALRLSPEPLRQFRVERDFFGVNVATGENPSLDEYVLARLRELGLTRVRMDLSYESLDGPAARLLDRLLDEGFEVLPDLFPPREEAARLTEPSAARRWRDFLQQVFARYGKRVAHFEIGNTPNRGKWSGLGSRTLLEAWNIALEEGDSAGVALAGPNVSDFEPLYSGVYLALIERLGARALAHTNNLFVERVVEPEALDHRVLGRAATGLLKLNLVKKARLLQHLGQLHGASELWCTYTLWTAKRLARRSPWPDRKQADYLVRYLALAAGSGALGRVYWGPLICGRDGLIDDGLREYPDIDQVTWYRAVRGDIAQLQPRPVFEALAATVSLLADTRVHCCWHHPEGSSLFMVTGNDGRTRALTWCRDNHSVLLADLFAEADLATARFHGPDGRPVPAQVVICERPLWIEFKGSPTPPRPPEPSRSLQFCSPQQVSAPIDGPLWRGAAMLRVDAQQQDLADTQCLLPESLQQLPEQAVLRDARNRIWNVNDPRGLPGQLSVKLNRVVGIKRLTYRFRPSKGRRHWDNACVMRQRGVMTPMPVAFFERHRSSGVLDSWYLCEFIPDAFSAREVYAAFRDGAETFRGLDKARWFELLAAFVCRMHDMQINHRDLSAGNLLLHEAPDGSIQPMLIDIGRAWIWRGPGSRLSVRRRLADLMRIAYKLDWTDRERFINSYEAAWGKSLPGWWRLPFRYYDNKQSFKKSIKGQRKGRRKSAN
jgi:hypothetical protein